MTENCHFCLRRSFVTFDGIELDILASLRIEDHLIPAFEEPDNSHKRQNNISDKS
jgi:hypothetical protein